MSQIVVPSAPSAPERPAQENPRPPRGRNPWKRALAICAAVALLAAAGFFAVRGYRALVNSPAATIPTAKVQRGDLDLTITARGDLHGQNPEILAAPMTGGTEMHITALRKTGELVKPGDTVVQFDTTEQEYKLKEAEADLAESEQHILQAKAQQQADAEEDRYALLKAQADVKLAELDMRKNPLLPAIAARQNELALHDAREHLAQLEKNQANRRATGTANIAIQQAGRAKAEAQATTARQNIQAMTLRAHHAGYVAVRQNQSGNFFFFGMTLPYFQVGDSVRPGMAVAEIPDLQHWEIAADIGELDRGHLQIGDPVAITVIALPGRNFTGHVKEIGGTTGPPWNRHFSCKLALDNPSPELRPGMSTQLTITTDRMRQVLWLPAQALFESDGRKFVYLRASSGFIPKDVTLLRRNETRIVIAGLSEGQVVALANPADMANKKKPGSRTALDTISK
jgi:HlyD family secretion protein